MSRAFECGKPEARPLSEGSHLAPGLRVSKCFVVSGGNAGTHNSPVKHCTPVWPSTLKSAPRQQRRSSWPSISHLPRQRKWLSKPPCPRPRSIRPLMNETVVKGHKAGGSCACVCVCVPAVLRFSVSFLRTRCPLQSWSRPSVFHNTLGRRQNTRAHGARTGCYQSRQKNLSNVTFRGYEQHLMEWDRMLRSTRSKK